MEKKFGDFFAARHSIKPGKEDLESKDFPGISEKGAELAKEKAASILELIDQAQPGTILFLGGSSEAVRTKSTAHALGEGVKQMLQEQGRSDIMVITKDDVAAVVEAQKTWLKTVQEIVNQIKANPDKKIFIDNPLFIKEFSMDPWLDKEGNPLPYTDAIIKNSNNDMTLALKNWLENQGKLGDLQGPDPTQLAKKHLEGITRLREFAKEQGIGDRPLEIGAVGHSWNLDALAIYLANNGKVDAEGLQKVGGEMINETETVRVEIDSDGAKLIYKGQEYPIDKEKTER